MSHTQAPWNLEDGHAVVGLVNGERTVIGVLYDMPCVGGHDDMAAQRGCDMEKENAALICAAPDLYESLNNLVSAYERGIASPVIQEYWANCRKALAKAKP